ncbi:MAG: DNA polymerase III subunit delta [Paludibacteraceae bacterium]|nr:DNA polymerase III subunit delta [Paludibacteraceae bacterium]
MLLKDIIGQEAIKREMCRNVQEGRIPHAQLLSGSAGIGKLPLALAYAQYVACPHRTPTDACGVCPTCLQYSKLQHPDLHFVFPIVKTDSSEVCDDYIGAFREMVIANPYCDADDWIQKMGEEKKQSLIYEKESSEIQRKLSLKAFGDGYKVMIVWQPEKMHIACANKLLKLLEEPPQMTLFLFVSDHPEQLLPTIISRLRPLPVPRLSEQEVIEALMSKNMIPLAQAQDAARLAHGSYREALRILDDTDSDKQMFADFQELMRNAWQVGVRKNYDALQKLNQWAQTMAKDCTRAQQCAFLQFAQRLIRENFIYNYGEPSLNYETGDERAFSVKFAPYINERNVEDLMNQFATAEAQIMQNANARIVLFDLCMQCIVLIKK